MANPARWLKRLALLVGTGTSVFLFLLVAQVNFDDLRLKLGGLRTPALPDVEIGGFYTITDDGGMIGPHCLIDRGTREALLVGQEAPVHLTNQLGASLPIIARWSSELLGSVGADDLAAFTGVAHAASEHEPAWDGYSLVLDRVERARLAATTAMATIMDASFRIDPGCENNVVMRAARGECVVVVFKVVRAQAAALGYGLADHRCFVPFVASGDPYEPRDVPTPIRFTSWLSVMKERLGILDGQV